MRDVVRHTIISRKGNLKGSRVAAALPVLSVGLAEDVELHIGEADSATRDTLEPGRGCDLVCHCQRNGVNITGRCVAVANKEIWS